MNKLIFLLVNVDSITLKINDFTFICGICGTYSSWHFYNIITFVPKHKHSEVYESTVFVRLLVCLWYICSSYECQNASEQADWSWKSKYLKYWKTFFAFFSFGVDMISIFFAEKKKANSIRFRRTEDLFVAMATRF